MTFIDRRERYCILGAGASGLAAAKNFRAAGIACDCLEREAEIGGVWNFASSAGRVLRSTHLISSKRQTEMTDFPMPKSYPPYPSQRQAWEYLSDYAREFGLHECLELGTTVEWIEPVEEPHGGWEVRLASGEVRRYRGVVIANGHNWDPRRPEWPGEFSGTMIHSAEYKTPDSLSGRRVLVVGAGNSGCDIAVEAAQHAEQTFHSLRRGYHFLPKFLRGRPIDSCGEWMLRMRLPLWLRRRVTSVLVKLAVGSPRDYGLPRADHRLFETHPIINSQLLYHVGHGDITIRGDVASLDGERVQFVDGTEETIDVIICATGYKISFPFLDREHLNWRDGRPSLFLNMFHPDRDDLFVAGMIQPDSGQWGLVDYQTQLIARYVKGLEEGAPAAERFRRLKQQPPPDLSHGIRYQPSERHLLEVEHHSYRRRLQRLIAQLG